MFKYIKKILLVVILAFLFIPSAKAENRVNLYFFRGEGCPHCAKEEIFLEKMEDKYSGLKVYNYEVWYSSDNRELLLEVSKLLKKNVDGVPFTVIGDRTFSGWDEKNYPKEVEKAIKKYSTEPYRDYVGEMLGIVKKPINHPNSDNKKEEIEKINIPFFGNVDPKTFSLPIITVIFGLLDGFNPCAMWILLFLISMLLGMKDRKRMWTLGITFIITSAAIYYVFMAAWLNLALLIGAVFWIRILIAIFAVIGGSFNIKSALKKKDGGCDVVDDKKRTKIFDRIKKFTKEKSFGLSILGIMALAVSVNLVEMFCSAGLPVMYSQILSMNHVDKAGYYGYIFLYIIFFMLDDIIVYLIAMKTLKLKGLSTKYGKWSHWIGGIIMILIGLLLVLKPGWLTFGG